MATVHHPPTDILLDPSDWYIANWRHLPPLPRPTPNPFDLDSCCARLARVRVSASGWNWSQAEVGACLGWEEGRFWLEAFARGNAARPTPAQLAKQLGKDWPLPRLSRDECLAHLGNASAVRAAEYVSALASQIALPDLMAILLDPWKAKPATTSWSYHSGTGRIVLAGFRQFVRPWMTTRELEKARALLRARVLGRRGSKRKEGLSDFVVSLMATLGMSDEVARAVENWRPLYYVEALSERHFAVLGLADSAQILPTLYRLHLPLSDPAHVRGVLAHLEGKAIPFVRDAIIAGGNRPLAERLTPALGLVHRPETAQAMLVLTQRSRAPAPAQRWLDEHPELAIPGLLSLLHDKKLAEPILNYLRQQVRAGQQALIDRHLEALEPDRAAWVRRSLETTAALQAMDDTAVPVWFPPDEKRRSRLPSWVNLATLPPLRIAGKRLPEAQVATLLGLLRDCPLEAPHAVFAQIKKHADPRLLDAFVWALFERWHSGSAEAKDKWALTALGHLGGDGVCLPLAALVGEWPGKSQHLRANHGLECLEAIGTKLALSCIHRLAETSPYALRWEAQSRIERVARKHGWNLRQLEDRIVPDLGLDQEGYRRLDSCGTTYRLTLGPDRSPRLLDDNRQYRSELPELHEGDDPAEVESARAEWDQFRHQARTVMQIQTERLENAMLRWRRWRLEDFERYLVRHPLVGHLTRALVWGAFETISKVRLAFRVSAGHALVDVAGFPVTFEPDTAIGVMHPVLLSAEERMIWSDVMAEQGVSLPDWQLARPVWTLDDREKTQRELTRWVGQPLDVNTLRDGSRLLGYESGAHQRNHICCRVQYYPALKLTVYLVHTPIPEDATYEMMRQATVELLSCQFRRGDTRTRVPNVEEAVPLGQIDPVLLDEVIGGMNDLTRKALKAT